MEQPAVAPAEPAVANFLVIKSHAPDVQPLEHHRPQGLVRSLLEHGQLERGIENPLLNRDSTLIVPKTAIVNSPEKVFVIGVRDNKALWITVQTGRTVDGKTEIYGKLQPGDQIVKVASEEIRDGMAVVKK